MAINLKRLSVFVALLVFLQVSKADSFLLSEENIKYAQNENIISQDQILPLIYIKNIEYYNQTQSAAYTPYITEYLALEPSIIITEDESLADYELIPKLLQSRIEPLNDENIRYNMSVSVELWAKGGVKVASAEQNRYIVIEKKQDIQKTAKQLLKKLLQEALNSLIRKIKNNQLNIS